MKTAIALIFAASINAAPVPQADLDSALKLAQANWGYIVNDAPVSVALVPGRGCHISNGSHDFIAHIQVNTRNEAVSSTISWTVSKKISWDVPDIPDEELPSESGAAESAPTVKTVVVSYVIQLDADCKWNSRDLDISKFVEHEYGHLVDGLNYHSKNMHSIMFWVVQPEWHQEITPEDRLQMKIALATVSK